MKGEKMKKGIIFGIAGFIAGAGIGAVGGYIYAKKRYALMVDDAIAEFKTGRNEELAKRMEGENNEITLSNEIANAAINKDINEYKEKIKAYNALYSKSKEEDVTDAEPITEEEPDMDEPYEIDDDYFDEENFDGSTWYYFEDGVFTYDDYMPVADTDVDDYIGRLKLKMEDAEVDSVCIRNPKYGKDICVLRDLRTYKEFLEDNPRIARLVNNKE